MTDITKDDVRGVLSKDEAISKDEIVLRIIGDDRCPTCGQRRNLREYAKAEDRVAEIMRELLSNGKIVSTPDWNYRLARKSYD